MTTSEVKIKKLVWSHRNDEPKHEVSADCAFGRYHILNRGEYGFGWCRPRCPVAEGFEPTAELAKAAAQADFEARIRSSLLPDVSGAEAAGWQPIETAPKDGTPVDLWGVNHLHPAKTGRRATDVTWGPVRDWMGNEREDWQDGQGEDFEPTHWMPLPSPPLQTEGK